MVPFSPTSPPHAMAGAASVTTAIPEPINPATTRDRICVSFRSGLRIGRRARRVWFPGSSDQFGGKLLGVEHAQVLHRPGEGDVEQPVAVGLLGDDASGL